MKIIWKKSKKAIGRLCNNRKHRLVDNKKLKYEDKGKKTRDGLIIKEKREGEKEGGVGGEAEM